ncbi:hypothetical protein C8A03DRAFT_32616 [Achaetomium macrosporum]|uniref:Uncharacterized protein n=1 Tax=Achaetomium macrosporum TaxID=79813 RepID=A0AAN7CC34_9PEZI|nr:hypothetical protein C8A03DRAFT_32616 [Achaetomium macrosporum]
MRGLLAIANSIPRATALRTTNDILGVRRNPMYTSRSLSKPSCCFYGTQIQHGQDSSKISGHLSPGYGPGPATGAGTGVFISAQMFGTEVKGNPTESEADVAADRCDADPLPPELHHRARSSGEAGPRPT